MHGMTTAAAAPAPAPVIAACLIVIAT